MIKRFLAALLLTTTAVTLNAQQKTDTVIVSLAKTSKVVFTIQDRSDLEILKHYNFQNLFDDILIRLQASDTIPVDTSATASVPSPDSQEEDWSPPTSEKNDGNTDEEWDAKVRYKHRRGRTWQSFNFDLGTNNYVTSEGKFPDDNNELYSVRPWGSWYLGFSSIQRTRVTRNFFIDWGLGLSWYNFKFQSDNVLLQKTNDGVEFFSDLTDVNHLKSKLSIGYVNASLIPILDFGDRGRKTRFWDGGSAFRIGAGPYIGYRVSSRSKMVFKEDGERETEKNRDSFYLNNLRYGARLQLGFRSTDLFFNYDMNELFAEGRGPKLNAFSFGVIF
jgi:hypothetical protein